MTKSLSHLLSAGALSLSLLTASGASAEVIFTETFDYPVGNLYGNPGWLQSNHKGNPIQVTATTLSLDGFASGKSVKLTPIDAKDQDVLKPFYAANADGTYTAIADGSVYAAFLINVQNVTNRAYVTGFGSTNYSNKITDDSSITGPYGITFVSPSESEGKYFLGISKSSTKTDINKATTLSNTELDYNTTYLVVLKYTVLSDTSNDTFEAWINQSCSRSRRTRHSRRHRKFQQRRPLTRSGIIRHLSDYRVDHKMPRDAGRSRTHRHYMG